MNTDVIVSCAVTGAGDTVGKHPDIPITPEQIASVAIEAAKAGAATASISTVCVIFYVPNPLSLCRLNNSQPCSAETDVSRAGNNLLSS